MSVHGIGSSGRLLVIDITPGEDLTEAIMTKCEEAGIKSGVLVSCIGSLKDLTITNAGVDTSVPTGIGDSEPVFYSGPIQVIAAQGFFGHDEARNSAFMHMHLTAVAGFDQHIVSGHVNPGWAIALNRLEAAILETDGLQIGTDYDAITGGKHLIFNPASAASS